MAWRTIRSTHLQHQQERLMIAERSIYDGANEAESIVETASSRKTTNSKAADANAGDAPTADVRRCMVQCDDGRPSDVIHDLFLRTSVSASIEALNICNNSGDNLCVNQPVMASIINWKPADTQFRRYAPSKLSYITYLVAIIHCVL